MEVLDFRLMACSHPLLAYRGRKTGSTGKRPLVFHPRDGFSDLPVKLPCGWCLQCRLEKARQWSLRCMHEASLYDDNCFVTITYNDDNLPASGSINKRDLQLFLKRLRKAVEPHKIRFFACGEYGDQLSRPHYHVLFFGYDFPDKIFWRFNKQQQKVYRSKLLEDCWQYGYSTVGNLTKQSVDYVCRYVLKK